MNNDKEAKFVSVVLKNRVELAKSVNINVNFLGSGHPASKHKGAGEKYGNYRDVYYKFNINIFNDVCTIELTFSGPTPLDIKKPTIKSLTKDAISILDDLIANIDLLKRNYEKDSTEGCIITINIKGHSRGGIIATEVRRWLINMKNNADKKFLIIGDIGLADPYSGPINRVVHKRMDTFNEQSTEEGAITNNDGEIANHHKIICYTVAERRFRSPAKGNFDKVIFTDVTHSKTQYIIDYVFRNPNSCKENGVYICPDKNGAIKKVYERNKEEKDPSILQSRLDDCIKGHIREIDETNINDILNGSNEYTNFAYKKISSDGRRELFYGYLMQKGGDKIKAKVLEFLAESGNISMISRLRKKGFIKNRELDGAKNEKSLKAKLNELIEKLRSK